MSYILDALRRAEAERERKRGGAAPSILQPELPPAQAPPPAPAALRRTGLPRAAWVAGGAALVVAAALAWMAARPPQATQDVPRLADAGRRAADGQAPVADAAQAPGERGPQADTPDDAGRRRALPVRGTGAAPTPLPSIEPPAAAAAQAPPEAVPPAAQAALPGPGRTATPATRRDPGSADQAARSGSDTAVPGPTAAPPPSPMAAMTQTPKRPALPVHDTQVAPGTPGPAAARPADSGTALPPLPDALQRQLAVSGSRYADDPAQRLLIVNGQVVREGGTLAPGLTLERIHLRTAVISHQGQRYELRY